MNEFQAVVHYQNCKIMLTTDKSDTLPKTISNGIPQNSLALRFHRICSRFFSVSTTSAPELDSWNILEGIRAH